MINTNVVVDRDNNNNFQFNEKIYVSPPKYEDLMITDTRSSIDGSPNFDFPMPVIPVSINDKNLDKF